MYADLPSRLQEAVKNYLAQNDFIAAKALHDEWVTHHLNEPHNNSYSASVEDSKSPIKRI